MDRMKIADVSTFDDDVYEKIAAGVFDPDGFDLVRAGKDASEEETCELVADSTIIMTDPMHFQHVTRRVIEATGNLELIPCYTLGLTASTSRLRPHIHLPEPWEMKISIAEATM